MEGAQAGASAAAAAAAASQSASSGLSPRLLPNGFKQIVFVRHAESLGQRASYRKRGTDETLVDCDLSPHGHAQLERLASKVKERNVAPELVVFSPLTRAVRTAVTLFPNSRLIVHPALAEVNSTSRGIPENRGRPWKQVVKSIGEPLGEVHVDLLHEHNWPDSTALEDTVVLEWLLERPESKICVVGHSNWAQRVLAIEYANNLDPYHLLLSPEGRLSWVEDQHDWFQVGY